MSDSVEKEFLDEVDLQKNNPLDEPVVQPEEPEKVEQEDDHVAPNRYWRRVEQKAQRYKEEAIALNERLKVLSEVNKFREEAGVDPIKEVRAIYGDDAPEKKVASDILENTLRKVKESAVNEAIERINAEKTQEVQEEEKEGNFIEDNLERLQDEHNVDFSEQDRKGFLTLLERVSPKDSEGNIKEFADFDATYELYERGKEKSNRAKELAGRSMTRSGASGESKLQEDANWRALKEMGIF